MALRGIYKNPGIVDNPVFGKVTPTLASLQIEKKHCIPSHVVRKLIHVEMYLKVKIHF